MRPFDINGRSWRVVRVGGNDPRLFDRTGNICLATTDRKTNCVYLSEELQGEKLKTVFMHEVGHCVMISYGILDDLHSIVDPDNWVAVEEWICNFLADHGEEVIRISNDVLGDPWLI